LVRLTTNDTCRKNNCQGKKTKTSKKKGCPCGSKTPPTQKTTRGDKSQGVLKSQKNRRGKKKVREIVPWKAKSYPQKKDDALTQTKEGQEDRKQPKEISSGRSPGGEYHSDSNKKKRRVRCKK